MSGNDRRDPKDTFDPYAHKPNQNRAEDKWGDDLNDNAPHFRIDDNRFGDEYSG